MEPQQLEPGLVADAVAAAGRLLDVGEHDRQRATLTQQLRHGHRIGGGGRGDNVDRRLS